MNFPKNEEEMLAYWKECDIFQKTLKKEAPRGSFVFFEGPPTANGRPGIHHAEARAFKDCIPRFRTMQGYHVARKAGWDTHGLPVELEVEKQLGFTGKAQIEEYGIAPFNELCKKSVWKYKEEWEQFTDRLGYWVDLENAYITYKPKYVESLWWVIKQIWDRGFLYKDYRVTPHCPRCGTSLSSHELSQGYKDVKDLSVYAKFPVVGEAQTFFLAWTTTPWTLPGNVALAVKPDMDYVVIDRLSFIPMEARRKHGEVKWFVDRPGVFCYAAWNDDYTDPTQGRLKVNLRVLEDAYWQHFAMAKDKAKQIILDKQAEDYIAHTVFGEER